MSTEKKTREHKEAQNEQKTAENEQKRAENEQKTSTEKVITDPDTGGKIHVISNAAADVINEFDDYETLENFAALTKIATLSDLTDPAHARRLEMSADTLKGITVNGEPAYTDITTDPETGEITGAKLTPAARQYLQDITAPAFKAAQDAIKAITERFTSNFTELLQDQFKRDQETLKSIEEFLKPAQDLLKELEELEPYIRAAEKETGIDAGGFTFDKIMEYTPGELLNMLDDPDSDLTKLLQAARKARQEGAPGVSIKRAKSVDFPLDKPNGYIWNLLTEDTRGQVVIDMLPKSKLNTTAIYAVDFDSLGEGVKITKQLLPFDKRVYIATSALFNAGNDLITVTQIYYAMGNTGRPNEKQLQKIYDAITKMNGAHIFLDNEQEADALAGKYPHYKYDGSLLPLERITATVNGKLTGAAIKIFREPPLITFAKERQQITTLPVVLLQSPVNKTDANLLIDDYLLERISREKNKGVASCRILFKTLYDRANIRTQKQKERAPEKIKKYLGWYKQQGFIKAYSVEKDGITIKF